MRPNYSVTQDVNAKYPVQDDMPNSATVGMPTLFLTEEDRDKKQYGYVGTVEKYLKKLRHVEIHFTLENNIPPIPQEHLIKIAGLLEIKTFNTNHHTIVDLDLFEILMKNPAFLRSRPTAFSIPIREVIDKMQVSVMMPFSPELNPVFDSINSAVQDLGLKCDRADNIWEDDVVMQDIANLIDRSMVVVCDCTLKNPNVFYEIGLAHTLGRDVILITQNSHDIPFDLRHRRYITYLNNGEGREELKTKLKSRISDLKENR